MSMVSNAGKQAMGDIAPKLAELTDQVLSKRDRSLITVSALLAMNRIEQLPFHLEFALENGVSREELVELTTHLAFYSGWPTAASAVKALKAL